MIRVLVGCEFSATVRDAFRANGLEAWSCDLLECDRDPEWHIQGDVIGAIELGWDCIVLHPPCTKICVSGNAHYGASKPRHKERLAACEWTRDLWEMALAHAPCVALENPRGVLSPYLGKPSQVIQPWQFGHPESKATCLWLAGLPPLVPSEVLASPESGRWQNQTPSGQNKLGPSPDRWKLRSITYRGIAEAMAKQWGKIISDC